MKIDLHTHSLASIDGSITPEDYFSALDKGRLNVIAITDHDRIDMAVKLARIRPQQIIIGQEISTTDGELIGLYLHQAIPAGLSAVEAAELVKRQGGVLVVPHPMERFRSSLSLEVMQSILPQIDAVELHNARSIGSNQQLRDWVGQQGIPAIAVSDAHTAADLGRSYSVFDQLPTAATFRQLAGNSRPQAKSATIRGRLAPKLNRLRKPKNG